MRLRVISFHVHVAFSLSDSSTCVSNTVCRAAIWSSGLGPMFLSCLEHPSTSSSFGGCCGDFSIASNVRMEGTAQLTCSAHLLLSEPYWTASQSLGIVSLERAESPFT